MLIRFVVANHLSYYEESEFSMLPGRQTSHRQHIYQAHAPNDIDVLRTALLYGANASGKSNLIRAMAFAQKFIVDGSRPNDKIRYLPYRLNHTAFQEPSRFEFEFIVDQQAYAYGYSADHTQVYEEWLYQINKKDEIPLFERKKQTVTFFFENLATIPEQEKVVLELIQQRTRPNQLVLTKLAEDNTLFFQPFYDWFDETLTIIFPDSTNVLIPLWLRVDERFKQSLSHFLASMNTGVDKVCLNEVEIDRLNIPLRMRSDIEADIDQDHIITFKTPQGNRIIVDIEDGQVDYYSLGTQHLMPTGELVNFDLSDESDGTQRLLDLFPVLYSDKTKVFVIDELERSLHPNLARRFIKHFLSSPIRNQLIVSTHESTLLDLDLLRRDEIWFVEKSPHGYSILYSLEEFKTRKDLDIRKGYLLGRFGAIPVFGSSLMWEDKPSYAETA